jgi:hypothetical protein
MKLLDLFKKFAKPTPDEEVIPVDPNVDDLLKRIDLSVLYPPFALKIKQLHVNCRKRGVDYYAICGVRTFKEQGDLYAQGRSTPGQIVTRARPGRSAHNYGIAVDGCKDADGTKAGLQPGWDIEDYRVWAEEAVKLGLEAGYNWTSFKEGPHVQMPLGKHLKIFMWDYLITINATGGNEAVWRELDKHTWEGIVCAECEKIKASAPK